MIIDFNKLDEVAFDRFKDGNGTLFMRSFGDADCRIMRQVLTPGVSSGLHKHEQNCEIVLVLKGVLTFHYDGKTEIVGAGQVHYCPRGHSHYMENRTGDDVECLAIVSECGK